MPSVTAQDLADGAFAILGVYGAGETSSSSDATFARTFLNDLLSEWSQRTLFIPTIARERFDLVSDQGGQDNPYTIGPGGDFDTERPSNQDSIVSANLILTATSPEVRVPLGLYTDEAYDANAIPDMSNSQPTGLYYSPTYADDLGSIFLWPVPDVATNDLELFLQKSLAQFANLSTEYDVPDGVPRLLKYNLADAIAVPYGRELPATAARIATSSLDTFKRANHKLRDQMNDAIFGTGRRTIYNIQSGSGG